MKTIMVSAKEAKEITDRARMEILMTKFSKISESIIGKAQNGESYIVVEIDCKDKINFITLFQDILGYDIASTPTAKRNTVMYIISWD